jgi:molecular chaperone HtpG
MDISIGKFTLESLTTGMYSEPESCFREYIQNAVDSIDMAIDQGLLQLDESRIEIIVDEDHREISIKDNGTGISSSLHERLCWISVFHKATYC